MDLRTQNIGCPAHTHGPRRFKKAKILNKEKARARNAGSFSPKKSGTQVPEFVSLFRRHPIPPSASRPIPRSESDIGSGTASAEIWSPAWRFPSPLIVMVMISVTENCPLKLFSTLEFFDWAKFEPDVAKSSRNCAAPCRPLFVAST